MAPEWNVPLAAAVPGRLPPFRDERGTCAQRVRKTDLLERDPFQGPFQADKLEKFFPEPDFGERRRGRASRTGRTELYISRIQIFN